MNVRPPTSKPSDGRTPTSQSSDGCPTPNIPNTQDGPCYRELDPCWIYARVSSEFQLYARATVRSNLLEFNTTIHLYTPTFTFHSQTMTAAKTSRCPCYRDYSDVLFLQELSRVLEIGSPLYARDTVRWTVVAGIMHVSTADHLHNNCLQISKHFRFHF